jgi:hypothetical protein
MFQVIFSITLTSVNPVHNAHVCKEKKKKKEKKKGPGKQGSFQTVKKKKKEGTKAKGARNQKK